MSQNRPVQLVPCFVGVHHKSSATSHTDVIDILVNFTKFGTLNRFIILYHSTSFRTRKLINDKLISKQVAYSKNKHIAISHTGVFAKRHSFTRVTYFNICRFFRKIRFHILTYSTCLQQSSTSHTGVNGSPLKNNDVECGVSAPYLAFRIFFDITYWRTSLGTNLNSEM